MNSLDASIKSNQYQFYGLVTLRFLIGWHFLYEGISKLLNPYWSSAAYLLDSKWIFSGIAKTIVSNPTLLTFSDYINMWGLTLVGVSLLFGIFRDTFNMKQKTSKIKVTIKPLKKVIWNKSISLETYFINTSLIT